MVVDANDATLFHISNLFLSIANNQSSGIKSDLLEMILKILFQIYSCTKNEALFNGTKNIMIQIVDTQFNKLQQIPLNEELQKNYNRRKSFCIFCLISLLQWQYNHLGRPNPRWNPRWICLQVHHFYCRLGVSLLCKAAILGSENLQFLQRSRKGKPQQTASLNHSQFSAFQPQL